MNVSQVNQPTLLKSLLELFGHTIDGPVLSRSAVQNIQAEAGVLANSAIAEKLAVPSRPRRVSWPTVPSPRSSARGCWKSTSATQRVPSG